MKMLLSRHVSKISPCFHYKISMVVDLLIVCVGRLTIMEIRITAMYIRQSVNTFWKPVFKSPPSYKFRVITVLMLCQRCGILKELVGQKWRYSHRGTNRGETFMFKTWSLVQLSWKNLTFSWFPSKSHHDLCFKAPNLLLLL
jgi:hypothetical protein